MAGSHLRLVRKEEEGASRFEIDRDQAAKLGNLIARGYGESEIRRVLSLSKRRYDYLCRVLSRSAEDEAVVWGKFNAATRNNIRRLDELARKAMSGISEVKTKGEDGKWKTIEVPTEPDLRVALRAVMEIQKIEERRIEVGQSLGIYPTSKSDDESDLRSFLGFFVSEGRRKMMQDHAGEIPAIELEPEYELSESQQGAETRDPDQVS